MEKILLKTSDNIEIVGNWLAGEAGAPGVLLLHMMPATKESWAELQARLRSIGYSSLAIDMRGHGESTTKLEAGSLKMGNGGKFEVLDYKKFSDSEHQAKIHDVEAAVGWLKARGIADESLAIVGASIGANLAIQYAVEHPAISAAGALSPGLDYRGVVTMPLVKAISRGQKLLLAASDDDPESYNAVQKLNEISLAKTTLKLLHGAGHGTTMLDKDPAFTDDLVKWIKEAIG